MLVTDDSLLVGCDLVTACRAAVRGGVSAVQLRLKQASARQVASAGRALLEALDVPVLINDRLDVAVAIGAAGVHLGPDDVPVTLARSMAPVGFVIGASVGTEAEVEHGRAADYWGIGPWAHTNTKPGAGTALGPAGFAALAARADGRPCVAIGGVRPEDVAAARAAGAAGVAVVSGILAATDPEQAARRYAAALASSRS